MGGDAWLNAYNFENESSIPLNYRILGLEGSPKSQVVYPVFRKVCMLSPSVMKTGFSLVLQGQAILFGLIYSQCQVVEGAGSPPC